MKSSFSVLVSCFLILSKAQAYVFRFPHDELPVTTSAPALNSTEQANETTNITSQTEVPTPAPTHDRVCTPGHFYETQVQECVACPRNTFKNESGQMPCQNCTEGRITEGTGATNGSLCVCPEFQAEYYGECAPCPLGMFFTDNKTCDPCPIGMYQDQVGQTKCVPCTGNRTTMFTGSHSSYLCICPEGLFDNSRGECIRCQEGEYFDVGAGKCYACAIGAYLSSTRRNCVQCPDTRTTVAPGSLNVSSCVCEPGLLENADGQCIACSVGHFLNATTSECQQCPAGTYQNAEGAEACVACSGSKTTVYSGADAIEECICPLDTYLKENQCVTCPKGTSSDYNSSSIESCQCEEGFLQQLLVNGSIACTRIECQDNQVLQWQSDEFHCTCLPSSLKMASNFSQTSLCGGPDNGTTQHILRLDLKLVPMKFWKRNYALGIKLLQAFFKELFPEVGSNSVYVFISETATENLIWIAFSSTEHLQKGKNFLKTNKVEVNINLQQHLHKTVADAYAYVEQIYDSRCTSDSECANLSCQLSYDQPHTTGVCSCPPGQFFYKEDKTCRDCPGNSFKLHWGLDNACTCPVDTIYDIEKQYCVAVTYPTPVPSPASAARENKASKSSIPPQKSRPTTTVVSIIAAVVAVLCIVAYVVRNHRMKHQEIRSGARETYQALQHPLI